jgi:hypothetical protein
MRSAASQERFQKAFTVEHMAGRVDALYQRLLREAHPRREPLTMNALQAPSTNLSTNGHLEEPLILAQR